VSKKFNWLTPGDEQKDRGDQVEQRSLPDQSSDPLERKRLSRLLRDILEAGTGADAVVLCEDCMNRLDLFVSDELDGLDVRRQHPYLWAHLQACESCRQEYEQLRDLLTRELRGDLLSPPPHELPRLPFLSPKAVPIWQANVVEEGVGEEYRLCMCFRFDLAYLQQSLIARQYAPARRGVARAASEEPTLLLADVVNIRGHKVAVQAHARCSEETPGTFCLDVNVATSLDVAETPTVILTWANKQYHALLDASGQARFAELPLQMLATATGDEPTAAFSLRVEIRPALDTARHE